MVYPRRLIICSLLGFVMGALCYLGGRYAQVEYSTGMIWATIFNRAFIGFVIGISAWRMNFLLHGIILGLLGSLPMAFGALASGGFWAILIFGAIWGFLIELLATLVFRAPLKLAEAN